MSQNEIAILNETDLRSKIYTIRGLQVMLDFDLAAIYGYETKRFNEQIKNNIERFDEDFRFQLSDQEVNEIRSRSKFSTLNKGRGSNIKYNPYAFTEQGIYMLMTVLKGDLAVRQSKALIRIFKQMKDFIAQSQNVLASPELLKLSIQTSQNTDNIREIQQTMVTKDYLQTVIKDFTDPNIRRDYLFFNGETVEASIAYSTIYSSAKKSIFIIDNYISLKTLVLLKTVTRNVKVVIFSDNIGRHLHKTEFDDFCKEYPNVNIELRTTGGIYHDRYIMIDHGTADEKIFHCGGSSKDGGVRTTSISQVEDKSLYKNIISDLQQNPALAL